VIAADTSTWVAYLAGETGWDVELLDKALKDRQVVMVPAVLTELLSDPGLTRDAEDQLSDIPLVQIEEGYWRRTGKCRAALLAKERRARLGDALIAQSCIDAGVLLVTRERDFQAFAEGTKLALATESA
jgi:predicted nucleic acid-binding protein